MWHGDILHEVHMEGLVAFIGGEASWKGNVWAFRRALSPSYHGTTWWRLVLDLRTLGLRSIHGGLVDSKEHMA
jgi:hypothetical protein